MMDNNGHAYLAYLALFWPLHSHGSKMSQHMKFPQHNSSFTESPFSLPCPGHEQIPQWTESLNGHKAVENSSINKIHLNSAFCPGCNERITYRSGKVTAGMRLTIIICISKKYLQMVGFAASKPQTSHATDDDQWCNTCSR